MFKAVTCVEEFLMKCLIKTATESNTTKETKMFCRSRHQIAPISATRKTKIISCSSAVIFTLIHDHYKSINSGHYHYQCVFQIWEQSIPWIWDYTSFTSFIPKAIQKTSVKICQICTFFSFRQNRTYIEQLLTGNFHSRFHFKKHDQKRKFQ